MDVPINSERQKWRERRKLNLKCSATYVVKNGEMVCGCPSHLKYPTLLSREKLVELAADSRRTYFKEVFRIKKAKLFGKEKAPTDRSYNKTLLPTNCLLGEQSKHNPIQSKILALLERNSISKQSNTSPVADGSGISEKATIPDCLLGTPEDLSLRDEQKKQSDISSITYIPTGGHSSWVTSFPEPCTKSREFLSSISCVETANKYSPKSDMRDIRQQYSRTVESADLPFSILTIREQRDFLKKSGESFVQDAPCYEISKMYGVETSGPIFGSESWCKCRECRSAKQKESLTVFCRFYGFRKLQFKDNLLCTAGFLLPEECSENDLRLWLPSNRCFTANMDVEDELMSPSPPLEKSMSDFILNHIGNQFCDIVLCERKAASWLKKDDTVYWKRPVSGVREMCDVCETTLFNMHWVCPKCGYGVCLDCYERRMEKSEEGQEVYDSDRTNCFRWLRCAKGKNHFHSSLLPTQIIPSTCLLDLSEMVHRVRMIRTKKTSICPCQKYPLLASLPLHPNLILPNKVHNDETTHGHSFTTAPDHSDSSESRKRKSSASDNWLSSIKRHEQRSKERKPNWSSKQASSSGKQPISLNDLIAQRIEHKKNNEIMPRTSVDLLRERTDDLSSNSCQLDNQAHRNWLCNGKLLQLTDSLHPKNIDIFKLHWRNEVPVLVSGVGKYLNMQLWRPDQISREYGDENSKNSLVNCITGSIVTNMKIRDFWDGFENISQRLLDENKKTMILKLKDWPPTQAFHDVMPEMFEDLMHALPLPDYTCTTGKCNLASRLPHFFVKPDLGPKMYNAYGWVTESDWRQGTTNLHLDISDAVNIMVYVGIPVDELPEARNTLLQIVREGEVDDIQFRRALTDKPGALWHIFHQRDVDKIRHFIKKVCDERGETVPIDHDPIHDQQMYLDKELRHRLKWEYNVEGYAILQCQGDGVFIPAGAPHQVFNLHSCIKIAEDFVSPEHVDKCFRLTNEFRYLSSTHSNHEDKLQIKNIIYHSVKDIVSSALHDNCM